LVEAFCFVVNGGKITSSQTERHNYINKLYFFSFCCFIYFEYQ
jgi:hypothetical protein